MDPPPLPFQLQDPERLRKELTAVGLSGRQGGDHHRDDGSFRAARHLWDWLVSSNPIVEAVLGELDLSAGERGVVQATLESLVRDRAGDGGFAALTNPVNIGVGTSDRIGVARTADRP